MSTETPPIGHNNPPAPTQFEAMQTHILDLMETAQGFLDGEPIANQETADLVGKLIDEARKAQKDGKAMRMSQTKPLDEAKKQIMDQWRPLIDEDTGKCALIVSTAKQALKPWLEHLEAQQRAEADKAREEAEKARQAALEAERAASAANLEAIERVELARKEAEQAERAANRADKAKAHATGGSRAIGLRSYWIAEITDALAFARWAWANRRTELLAALEVIAKHEATGPKNIPGLTIHEDRRAA